MSEKKEKKVTVAKKADAVVVKKKSAKEDIYSKGAQYAECGKRKNASARVVLRPGKGKFIVNDKYDVAEYFNNRKVLLSMIYKPLEITNMKDQYDIFANTDGGGKAGQAGAVAHGLAKAIVLINPDMKKQLKIEGLITRDSRVKESKKYGRKRARKGYTYRKR